ncbi:Cys-tRNA(Pro) deacylase [Cytobacillus spongiae]|uniref:Cys-tRNA(Pro) deacylase n=1 Tax=Cytobacillus spongiae TaxID=2901381 RepID=UPI001F185ABF|nr:Cys-tRNA(Pro) deacylase [Cytobacillus spongiae]UII55841.1 Cys-tRNA(Pro) deacylase [Cytobacillus spongiae]
MAKGKTNAMRILDGQKVDYEMLTYESTDGQIDGVSVAKKIGKPVEEVFKTLVAQGTSKAIFVFIIPVEAELDMKKAAKAAGEKKVEMIPVKDIQKHTGYIRGGCSPVGMKKEYPTFLDETANTIPTIIVSGGKIGLQMVLAVESLQQVTNAVITDLIKD